MDLWHLYTSFDGRINRGRYWGGAIGLGVVNFAILLVVAKLLGSPISAPDPSLLVVSLVLSVPVLYPAAALTVKRLHDRDRPAWLAAVFLASPMLASVVNLIPTGDPSTPNMAVLVLHGVFTLVFTVVNIWGFIELGCLRGDDGTNQYGPNPLGAPEHEIPSPPSGKSSTGLQGSDYYKKCSACGKITRGAKVCRSCGHDLTEQPHKEQRAEPR
jgi:uncharacterized membrane protein YhaH (DUF805 family)